MRKLLTLILLLVIASATSSAQISFSIIPPRDVVAGNQFKVVYRLSNAQGNALNAPAVSGCELRYGPSTSSSQSVQIINGQTTSSSSVDYAYIYVASKEGEYTIPAATIRVGGKTLTADAQKFRVLPADKVASQTGSSVSVTDRSSQAVDRPIGKDDIFVRVILNKNSAYENEAVECTLKLYTKYEAITSFSASSTPTYEGFLVEDVEVKSELNALENYNGQNYRTAILRKYILYPQKSGKLTVTSGSYDIVVQQLERIPQGFFNYTRTIEKPVKLREYTSTINVKPLPQPAPAGYSGAVGEFTVKGELSTTKLKTGEAATLTYSVTGTGNVKFLKDPDPQLPSEFECYPPAHSVNARVSGANMTGTMTSEFTFVPQYPGEFQIPAYDFVYFQPSKGAYSTVTVPAMDISVAKGAPTASSSSETPGLKAKNADIRYIHVGHPDDDGHPTYIVESAIYWVVYLLLLVALIAWLVIAEKQRRRNADVASLRRNKAGKVAKKHLRLASAAMNGGDKTKFYDALIKAMRGYLADKLSIPASELVRDNMSDRMMQFGMDQLLIDDTLSLIDDCEMARFTPDVPELAPEQLYAKAQQIINNMEASKK